MPRSLPFLVIGRLQNRRRSCFWGWGVANKEIHVYAGTKFPIYKVWWLRLREPSQIGQTFYPYCEKSFKTARQKSNRSSKFGCNWTSFHSKSKLKIVTRVWGDMRARTTNRILFLFGLILWGSFAATGPNFIALLTGKQIFVLTAACRKHCLSISAFHRLTRKFRAAHARSPWICIVANNSFASIISRVS